MMSTAHRLFVKGSLLVRENASDNAERNELVTLREPLAQRALENMVDHDGMLQRPHFCMRSHE